MDHDDLVKLNEEIEDFTQRFQHIYEDKSGKMDKVASVFSKARMAVSLRTLKQNSKKIRTNKKLSTKFKFV